MISCLNLAIFFTMATVEDLAKFEWLRLIGRPQEPSLVQKSGTYFKFDLILVNFVWKVQIFVTMATGVGLTRSNFHS